MNLQPNAVRKKLAAGECVTGAAIFSWSPNVVDAAVLAGLDYIRIDTEHAWRKDDALEHLIRAAAMGGVVPIVRVDGDDPYLVRKALEIGAGGIVVPNICSVAQAESVVEAAKFPPLGKRGLSRNCWSAGWGSISGDEWVDWSNHEPMIGIMIENVAAMPSIDDIAGVEGIDFILFGPADYSMSLGLDAPDSSDERVQDAITATAAAVRAKEKHFSLGVGNDPANIEKHMRLGVDMLELGNDLGIVRSGWERAKAAVETVSLSARV
jgi:4-hydroxy-2-oxoheptanedioate aldolase